MYFMKPVFDLDAKVQVPDCMYTLPVIQSSNTIPGVGVGVSSSSGVLEALEARQDAILARLERLKVDVAAYRSSLGLENGDCQTQVKPALVGRTQDMVVRCSPSHPAFSLPSLLHLLAGAGVTVHTSTHSHSSLTASLPPALLSFLPPSQASRSQAQVRLTLVWSDVGRECEVMVSPLTQTTIRGEVNLLRYLARLLPAVLRYEDLPGLQSLDSILDSVSSLLWATPRDRQPLLRSVTANLSKSQYVAGDALSIADLALFSAVKQLGLDKELQPEVARWFKLINGGSGDAPAGKEKSAGKGKSPSKEVKEKKAKSNKSAGKEKSPSPPSAGTDTAKTSHLGKQELFQYFDQNNIKYHNVEHPEVFTVEAMMPYLKNVEGAICKNLFLKDKKKNFYLLSARHDREVKLNDVAKAIGAKELRFADENVMFEMLGVKQGCVTAYALVNDKQKHVKFIVDKTLLDVSSTKVVNFHPLVNTATTGISCQDFTRFLKLTGHTVLEI